jgi:AcrR family transcriptional regulator
MSPAIEQRHGANGSDHRIDGRRLRGERTRTRVLDALLALVEEGELHPTAQAVASRAGVALRTVYHHFEDVEALRGMALEIQIERHLETLTPVDRALPVEDRILQAVRQLRKLFEAITPIRRATLFEENESSDMADGLARAREARRAFLEQSFSHELDRRAGDDLHNFVDTLDVTTAWNSWYYIRHSLGRPVAAAEAIVASQLRSILVPS